MITFKQYLIESRSEHQTKERSEVPLKFVKAAEDIYSYFYDYSKPSTFDQSIDLLLQHPSYQYRGKMYRALLFDPAKIREISDTRIIMSKMHEWAVNFPDTGKYQAFATTHRALQAALKMNVVSGIYDVKYAPYPFFVLQQQGVGVRVKNVIKMRVGFEKEDEILAEINNSANLVGFYLGDTPGNVGPTEGRYYTKSQFQPFLRAARSNDIEWNKARRHGVDRYDD